MLVVEKIVLIIIYIYFNESLYSLGVGPVGDVIYMIHDCSVSLTYLDI